MTTVVLAIGRDTPTYGTLSDWEWGEFRHELYSIAEDFGTVLNFGDVVGIWEGVEEQSYVVTFTCDALDVAHLDRKLRNLATSFEQDAIGRIVHVPANPVPGGWSAIGESVVSR